MVSITVTMGRQYAEDLRNHLFPYLKLLKQSKLNNVARCSSQSREYLQVLILNCLTDELMLAVNKKLFNTVSKKVKLKLSDALAVIFYSVLIGWPLEPNQFYLNNMRQWMIQELDRALTNNLVYQRGVQQKEQDNTTRWWEFVEE